MMSPLWLLRRRYLAHSCRASSSPLQHTQEPIIWSDATHIAQFGRACKVVVYLSIASMPAADYLQMLLIKQQIHRSIPTQCRICFSGHSSTAHWVHCCRISAMRLFTKPSDFWCHQRLLYSSLQLGYKTVLFSSLLEICLEPIMLFNPATNH
ncbi:hypothetical protein EDB19DRAFT_1738989 [Suillus lakei]|nr:hypothetical protein EDB19DRAFT_1738989 [Suillus lakei]